MSKNFPKIFIIAIFISGILLGFLLSVEIGIKYFFENKILPSPIEIPKEEIRTVTGTVKFRAYREEKIPFAPPPSPPPLPPLGFSGSSSLPSETPPSETTQQNDTNNATNSLEYVMAQIPVENVLLAIVGQNGKIIKTITTGDNGEAEVEITVPLDLLFSLTPKMSVERGVINVVSFKEGYVETVLLNIPVFPVGDVMGENIIYDVQIGPLMPPYQRNSPRVTDEGGLKTWHRLEILDFIEGVANALNLKPAYY